MQIKKVDCYCLYFVFFVLLGVLKILFIVFQVVLMSFLYLIKVFHNTPA